jgi:hypothetical protein
MFELTILSLLSRFFAVLIRTAAALVSSGLQLGPFRPRD